MFSSNKIAAVRETFIASLEALYEKREAENITALVFFYFKKWSRSELVIYGGEGLTESELLKFHFALKELKTGKPVQYVLGETEFYGLKFFVNPSVLIPRPETEELVNYILNFCKSSHFISPAILDIGTGSGCIPVAIKKNMPSAKVSACDISPEALSVAKTSAEYNETDIDFFLYDILSENGWPGEKLDIIVSNPPYIPEDEKKLLHKNVIDYEPHLALFVSNSDPLIFYRRIISLSKIRLNKNGMLTFEVHENFAREVKKLAEQNDFVNVEIVKDMQGKDRIVTGFMRG